MPTEARFNCLAEIYFEQILGLVVDGAARGGGHIVRTGIGRAGASLDCGTGVRGSCSHPSDRSYHCFYQVRHSVHCK